VAANAWPGRLILATIAGAALAAFLGWTLLTWALSLMFLLGLFFFMLFGLLIGAVVFRIAAPARPIARSSLTAVTMLVTLAGWLTAVLKEATDFPHDFTQTVMRNAQGYNLHVPTDQYQRVEGEVQAFITKHLEDKYPPGGVLGYFKLASSGAAIELDLPNQLRKARVPPRAPPWAWWTRVLLAPVLLAFAINSMISSLRNASDPPRRKSAGPAFPDR
jgi:hypothetical protein